MMEDKERALKMTEGALKDAVRKIDDLEEE